MVNTKNQKTTKKWGVTRWVTVAVVCTLLAGCAGSPPEAPKATGQWEALTTTVQDISKGF